MELKVVKAQLAQMPTPVLSATETGYQIIEMLSCCDQWPNTNVTFDLAPLLPFHDGNPFMSGEIWNDVKNPAFDFESMLDFTGGLNEGVPAEVFNSSTSEIQSESSYYLHHFYL